MSLENPISVASLKQLCQDIVQHTRPVPTASSELLNALNFGHSKAIRALASVRYQSLQSFVDPFVLLSGVTEYDLDTYDPPVWRPHKLIVDGSGGTTRVITFRYRAITSAEFQDSETARAGTFNTLYYDILTGMLPSRSAAIDFGSTPTTIAIQFTDNGRFQVGNLVSIPGSGPTEALPGGGGPINTTYRGLVWNIAFGSGVIGDLLSIAPAVALVPGFGGVATPLRRRVLKVVPALNTTISGRLYYQYRPPKLANDTDTLDPWLSEHRDMIVWYAVSMLLGGVNDAQGRMWFEQAQEMRSEMMQDIEPLSGQGSEALDSDLWGTE